MVTASARSAIAPFHAMAMSREAEIAAATGRDVLHLEVGQPGTPAPAAVRERAARAAKERTLGYTNAPGLPQLRERIAAHAMDWYGVTVDPGEVIVTAGASAGFTLAFLACFDPGDRVGVVEPGYPCYRNTLEALGCEVVPIPVDAGSRWAPTPEHLAAAGPLRGFVVASPSNPTGTVFDPAAVLDHCRTDGITVIADEIYHGLTFSDPARSALELDRAVVVVNSFSKYFSMTGWRVGWVVAPPAVLPAIERLQQNLYICAPAISQYAAVAAFDCHDELHGHVERYARNRAVMLEGLAAAGITATAEADGAFYVYADVGHLTTDSMGLCRTWLHELDIATTPGVDFDPVRGDRFVRFSYAGATETVEAACDRLGTWVAQCG